MECLRDVSWDYKGAGGIDTAATIGGGVQTETNLLIIIIIRNDCMIYISVYKKYKSEDIWFET